VQSFIVLSFWGSLRFYTRFGFYVHVGMLLTVGFFNSPAGGILRQKLKQKKQRLEAAHKKETPNVTSIPEHPDVDTKQVREEVDAIARSLDSNVDALKQNIDSQIRSKTRRAD
jgi:lysophospholipid acyltransferase